MINELEINEELLALEELFDGQFGCFDIGTVCEDRLFEHAVDFMMDAQSRAEGDNDISG